MPQKATIIFVCEHGAAKSILAAAYFNQIAGEKGLDLIALARGTNPDDELSPHTVSGLSRDGLPPTESVPKELTQADIESARQVIAFCQLPIPFQHTAIVESWEDVPPVSENYERARDIIVDHILQMLSH